MCQTNSFGGFFFGSLIQSRVVIVLLFSIVSKVLSNLLLARVPTFWFPGSNVPSCLMFAPSLATFPPLLVQRICKWSLWLCVSCTVLNSRTCLQSTKTWARITMREFCLPLVTKSWNLLLLNSMPLNWLLNVRLFLPRSVKSCTSVLENSTLP